MCCVCGHVHTAVVTRRFLVVNHNETMKDIWMHMRFRKGEDSSQVWGLPHIMRLNHDDSAEFVVGPMRDLDLIEALRKLEISSPLNRTIMLGRGDSELLSAEVTPHHARLFLQVNGAGDLETQMARMSFAAAARPNNVQIEPGPYEVIVYWLYSVEIMCSAVSKATAAHVVRARAAELDSASFFVVCDGRYEDGVDACSPRRLIDLLSSSQ